MSRIGIVALALAGALVAGPLAARDMSSRLACLAQSGGAAVSAHRGGPVGPENSLAAIRGSLAAGVSVIEIDVARTRDGQLVLMHDRTLDRTTTGTGPLSAMRAREFAGLRLRDRDGAATQEALPGLAEALALVGPQAVVTLDFKPAVSREDPAFARDLRRLVTAVARSVTRAGARDRVAMIAYSAADAALIRRIAPWAVLSISGRTDEDLDAYRALGIDPSGQLVFTGVPSGLDSLSPLLGEASLPAMVGTLGAPGRRLDDRFAADGDLSEYLVLVRAGADLIATDAAIAVQQTLTAGLGQAPMDAARQCLTGG